MKNKFANIIQYTSTAVMFLIVIIWLVALVFTAIIVWQEHEYVDSFTTLASVVTAPAVIGYYGRIALTHWQTIRQTGAPVPNDFSEYDIVNELEDNDETVYQEREDENE